MSEQQITDYLKKYNINSKEQLAVHILELKRNTIPNVGLISELVYVLEDENFVFNSFLRKKSGIENKYKTINILTDEIGQFNFKTNCDFFDVTWKSILNNHISEVINDSQQEKISSMFLDEVVAVLTENKGSSTIHKSRQGETYIVGDLEGINRPPYNFSAQKTEKENDLVFTKDSEINKEEDNKSIDWTKVKIEYGRPEHWGKRGIKESQATEKPPVFTYCKVNKNALEALSLRALYGHKKYNVNGADEDWQNFTRVPNAEEEYANAQFRHALQIGGEENEKEHLVSSAWNAISRLEIYLRKNLHN